MRVVLLILDSMPHTMVNESDTPNLWMQGQLGGRAPEGGMSLPVSVTYSNHAAFVTGIDPSVTKLWGNHGWDGDKFVATATLGPQAPTLFDRCREAGLRAVAAVGDHHIVSAIGAEAAAEVWPPTADVPPGALVDDYGYPADSAVIAAASQMDLDADLVVLHLNEPDTTLHVYGPDSDEASAQIRKSDEAYGELVKLLEPGWDETILFTISDHTQEQISQERAINLRAQVEAAGLKALVAHEGTGATVVGEVTAEQIASLDGIEGATQADHQTVLAWTEPGYMFGKAERYTMGNHGSPRCRTQVAIVSGGHAKVGQLARQFESEQPTTLTYAPLISELLGL